jgi:hypothetical protein
LDRSLLLRGYELHATVPQFGNRSRRYSPKHRQKIQSRESTQARGSRVSLQA